MILTAKGVKPAKVCIGLLLLVRTVRVLRGSRNLKGVFIAILTAKDFFVFFSLFVPFACFAVQDFQPACPLQFSPRKILLSIYLCSRRSRSSRFKILNRSVHNKFHRETRENREQKKGVSPVAPKRFEVESKEKVSPPLQGGNREP